MRDRAAACLGAVIIAWLLQGCADPAPTPAAVSVRPLWRVALPAGTDVPSGTPAANADAVFVVASGLQAYSIASGSLLWAGALRSYVPRALVATSDRVIV